MENNNKTNERFSLREMEHIAVNFAITCLKGYEGSFTDVKVGMIVKDSMNDEYKITNINNEVELTPKTFYGEPSYYPSDFNDDVSNFWGHFTLVK